MNKYLFLLSGSILGCTSIQYREPIEIPQEEVAHMTVIQSGTEQEYSLGVMKIRDCYYKKMGLFKDCSQIICKKDSMKPTGLKCLIYHPE